MSVSGRASILPMGIESSSLMAGVAITFTVEAVLWSLWMVARARSESRAREIDALRRQIVSFETRLSAHVDRHPWRQAG